MRGVMESRSRIIAVLAALGIASELAVALFCLPAHGGEAFTVSRVAPRYPQDSMQPTGSIVLRLMVNKAGVVQDVIVTDGSVANDFVSAAKAAAMLWRFFPLCGSSFLNDFSYDVPFIFSKNLIPNKSASPPIDFMPNGERHVEAIQTAEGLVLGDSNHCDSDTPKNPNSKDVGAQ